MSEDGHTNGQAEVPPRPEALEILPDGIPAAMRERGQWTLWKWELIRDGHRGPKWTKVPYRLDGRRGSSTNPQAWCSFADALATYRARKADGIGYVFSPDDPFTGIDLDGCRDPGTGALAPWAVELLDLLGATFAEVSVRGGGIHAIVAATLQELTGGAGKNRPHAGGKVEVYDRARFFAVSGHVLDGRPLIVVEAQAGVAEILRRVVPAGPKPKPAGKPFRLQAEGQRSALWAVAYENLTDDDLLTLGREAKNREKFVALFDRGDISGHDGDDSKADAALCSILAYWCRGERPRVDRLFRQSRLMRPKWEQPREETTYGGLTLDYSLGKTTEYYQPRPPKGKRKKPGAPPVTGPPSGEAPPQPEALQRTAATVIYEWMRETLDPTFRRGPKVYSAKLGRELGKSEVYPTSDVIGRIGAEFLANKKGDVCLDDAPKLYREWFSTAWGDLLTLLPEETATGELVEPASEEFRGKLAGVLTTIVSLGYKYKKNEAEEVRRYPLIQWCQQFAKEQWADVRGHYIWCRRDKKELGGRLHIAIRAELFSQLRSAGLAGINHARLSHLCQLYGLGSPCKVKGGALRAVELEGTFLDDLSAAPADDCPDARIRPGPAREGDGCPTVRGGCQSEEAQGDSQGRTPQTFDENDGERLGVSAALPPDEGPGRSDQTTPSVRGDRPGCATKEEDMACEAFLASEGREEESPTSCDDGCADYPFDLTATGWDGE